MLVLWQGIQTLFFAISLTYRHVTPLRSALLHFKIRHVVEFLKTHYCIKYNWTFLLKKKKWPLKIRRLIKKKKKSWHLYCQLSNLEFWNREWLEKLCICCLALKISNKSLFLFVQDWVRILTNSIRCFIFNCSEELPKQQ